MKKRNLSSLIDEEYRNINNNLAIPLYRNFCKEYGIKFHFGDESSQLDEEKLFQIRHKELALQSVSLALFNSINKPYHISNNNLINFNYTSWNDFEYSKLDMKEIAIEMVKKDLETVNFGNMFIASYIIAFISSFALVTTLVVANLDSIYSTIVTIPIVAIVMAVPWFVPTIGKRIKFWQFNKKLNNLKYQLKVILDKYEKG